MSTIDFLAAPMSFEVPAMAMTLDGFRAWAVSPEFPERGRVTFVEGSLHFDMSPEAYESHLSLKREITFVIESLVRDTKLGEVYIDGAWFTHSEAKVSNEPDVMFATWDTLRSGRFRPAVDRGHRYDEMVGSPDWVCEIVSDSSVRKDTSLLPKAYFKAGISEYWILDARGEEVVFQLLVAGQKGYEAVIPDSNGFLASSVFGRSFQVQRDEDELGRWCYTLLSR